MLLRVNKQDSDQFYFLVVSKFIIIACASPTCSTQLSILPWLSKTAIKIPPMKVYKITGPSCIHMLNYIIALKSSLVGLLTLYFFKPKASFILVRRSAKLWSFIGIILLSPAFYFIIIINIITIMFLLRHSQNHIIVGHTYKYILLLLLPLIMSHLNKRADTLCLIVSNTVFKARNSIIVMSCLQ